MDAGRPGDHVFDLAGDMVTEWRPALLDSSG
jgi:hypothetical protein